MGRHRGYRWLLAIGVAVLLSFGLPGPWARLSSVGYLALAWTMLRTLAPANGHALHKQGLYRALGLAAMASGVLWYVTPVELQGTGVPVLALWGLFSGWSALRLILTLAQERHVNGAVLQGALAGYLMLGLTGGLLYAALETIQPGSFNIGGLDPGGSTTALASGVETATVDTDGEVTMVWELNFVRLNYFAFISLTTTGYGDVLPVTPVAQISSVIIAVAGTFYLAVVMGLLISRFSQEATDRPAGPDGDG